MRRPFSTPWKSMKTSSLFFCSCVVILTLATYGFIWVLRPYYAALSWAMALAVLFHPVQRRLLTRFRGRANLAATITLLMVLLSVILPMITISAALIQEIATEIGRAHV